MPHRIDGVDLDQQLAYADAVRCPGSGTFGAAQPHARPTRLVYSGRSLWSCNHCGRAFVSSDVAREQQRVRVMEEGECSSI